MNKYLEYHDSDFLVSPERIQSFILQTSVKIIDIRKEEEYKTGHLPGAVPIRRDQLESSNYPYSSMMLEREGLESLFSELGIQSEDTLLLTDGREGYDAARLWWILHNYGFYRSHIADGGIHSQIEHGVKMSTELIKYPPSVFRFTNDTELSLYADMDDVIFRDEDTVVLDVRAEEEYAGKILVKGAYKSGHIVGAEHLDYKMAIGADHMVREKDELSILYEKYKDNPLILYCQAGYRSAFTLMVFYKLLGYKAVKNYDGSWIEYSFFEDAPKVCEGYDLIIIGGGSAGLSCASKGAAKGLRIALVEQRESLGGECLHSGCVPSKALLHCAGNGMSYADALVHVAEVQRKIGVKDKRERFEKMGVEVYCSFAKFRDSQTVELSSKTVLKGKNIVLASGSHPVVPVIEGMSDIPVYTNETIFQCQQLPERLLVIGAGAIGCELGYAYALFGSAVTVIETGERIMPTFDKEIGEYYQGKMKAIFQIFCNSQVHCISEEGKVLIENNGELFKLEADAILLATGRKPNIKGLGAEDFGIISEDGCVRTDAYMKTKMPHVFAAGDVTGVSQLSHTAATEADTIIRYLHGEERPLDYSDIPMVIYTEPQMYQIGECEDALLALSRAYISEKLYLEELDRFQCDDSDGMIKILVDPSTEMLLGAAAVGTYAGEWMQLCSLLKKLKLPVREFQKVTIAYPSYATALETAIKRLVSKLDRLKAQKNRCYSLKLEELENIKLFVLDMDGTFYLGERILDGALEFLEAARRLNKKVLFFTNNSSKTSTDYIQKLAHMDCFISQEEIMTSGDVTIGYVKKHYLGKNVFLVGTDELKRSFAEAEITLSEDEADIVIVGFDTSVTYGKLEKACSHIRNGALFIATHPDINCPVEGGFIPDCGAICKAIELSTGIAPIYMGKPSAAAVEMITARTGYVGHDIAFVGDRLYTDVKAGVNNGCFGILVLSGETVVEDLEKSVVLPDAVYKTIGDILS